MKKLLLSIACAAAFATGVSNASIIQQFSASTGCGVAVCGTSGGTVTFTQLAGNKLQITFDNTTDGTTDLDPGAGTYFNSSVIDGIVFNIVDHINAATIESFVDGDGNAITNWVVAIDVNNQITPGNTVFDIGLESSGGITGGIYNAADPGSTITNVVPDIATIVLAISDPDPFTLSSIGSTGDDATILRMQRVGLNGQGSLKIPTSTSSSNGGPPQEVPEPGSMSLVLFGVALLGASLWSRRRSMQS